MPRSFKLKNGLSVIVKPISGTKALTVFVMVPVGSRYETEKISGASHFVEHLMFKGTEKKRPTTLHISRELDAAGAQYNAFTSKDFTGYFIKIDGGKIDLALDVLSDMLFHSKFDSEEVKKEKGVILEEMKMYKDNPAMAVGLNLEKLFFGKHPLGWDIAGTKKSITKITRRELYDYYKSAYRPENMVLAIAGNVGKKFTEKINKYFGVQLEPKIKSKIRKNNFLKFSDKLIPKHRFSIEKRKLDQANVLVAFPGLPHNDHRRFALGVLLNILGGGMSSRLFVEVREKRGLAYKIRISQDVFRDCGLVWIDAGLDTARLKQAFLVIKDEIRKICRSGVSEKELANAKSNIAGQFALKMEDSSAQADFYASKFWFENNLDSYEKDIIKLKKVTAKQVHQLAKEIFKENKMKIAIISPLSSKEVIKLLK